MHIHDDRDEGWENFLFVWIVHIKVEEQEPLAEPTVWASNSGEEKDNLDHSATGHFINQRVNRVLYKQTSRSHMKNSGEI